MIDRTTIAAIAAELGLSWHTVNTIAMRALAELITAAGPGSTDRGKSDRRRRAPLGASTPSVPSGFVTFIVDLTPPTNSAGPARLLDLVPGR